MGFAAARRVWRIQHKTLPPTRSTERTPPPLLGSGNLGTGLFASSGPGRDRLHYTEQLIGRHTDLGRGSVAAIRMRRGGHQVAEVFVINHITLDGVMQGPGHADEDTRDGFTHGAWAAPGMDPQIMTAMDARIQQAGGLRLLLGRRTYERMLSFWNSQGDPFRDPLNNAQKYVASTTLQEPLPWPNSELLAGTVAEAVTALKEAPGHDLCIMGSGDLIQTLLEHRLIDEFLLFIHPVVLGAGRRLFPPDGPGASLQLVGSFATTTGVVGATYRTA